jgi:hypothetical protein
VLWGGGGYIIASVYGGGVMGIVMVIVVCVVCIELLL